MWRSRFATSAVVVRAADDDPVPLTLELLGHRHSLPSLGRQWSRSGRFPDLVDLSKLGSRWGKRERRESSSAAGSWWSWTAGGSRTRYRVRRAGCCSPTWRSTGIGG